MDNDTIRKLLDAATPGPWKVCETTIHGAKYGGCWVEGPDVDDGDGRPHGLLIPITGSHGATSYTTRLLDRQPHDHNDANARLIAAAPDLAAEVLRLRAELAAAREALRLAGNVAMSVRIARSSLGPHADVGHLEAVALRYVRWSDLANLEAALAKIGGQ